MIIYDMLKRSDLPEFKEMLPHLRRPIHCSDRLSGDML